MVQIIIVVLLYVSHIVSSQDTDELMRDELKRECSLSSETVIHVQESHPIATPVVTLGLNGEVDQSNATIILTIDDGSGYLRLEGKDLYLMSSLVGSSLTYIPVTLKCALVADPIGLYYSNLYIFVNDENLNTPQFQNQPYEVAISELTPITTTFYYDILATDEDSGSNARIQYTILQNHDDPEAHEYFGISQPSTGNIYLKRSLDFETKSVWKIRVQASDEADVPRTNITTVSIYVLNGDDISPYFLPCYMVSGHCITVTYSTSVIEETTYNSSLAITPGPIFALDGDVNITDIQPIVYSIVSGTPTDYPEFIRINSSTADVYLLKPVNWETHQQFRLKIQALQGQHTVGLSAVAFLNVSVFDVNEYVPRILETSLMGYINENSIDGTVVVTNLQGTTELVIHAEDKDVPLDGEGDLVYILNGTDGVFQTIPSFDTLSAMIVVSGRIDRELKSEYHFTVIAMENMTDEMYQSEPVSITIQVLDINDQAPEFLSNEYGNGINGYIVSIRENLAVDQVFFAVMATDPDLDLNGQFDFSIQSVTNNGNSKFGIEQVGDTANIKYVGGALIAREVYIITLAALDRGTSNTQKSVTSIEVNVLPTNDTHPPEFTSQEYAAAVLEEASIGTYVITLTAIDEDNDEVRYTIINGNVQDTFFIGTLSGEMIVVAALDREITQTYLLTVQASDNVSRDTATLLITVQDSNDNNPVFNTSQSAFTVPEGISGNIVGQVQAYDIDEPGSVNSQIEYTLISEYFHIDAVTGVITTSVALDRETQDQYVITVTAQDKAANPRSTRTLLTITVLDMNDNGPYFEQPLHTVMINENTVKQDIITIQASDHDLNPVIEYSIVNGNTSIFALDTQSGNLSIILPLDYEQQQVYELTISATDVELSNTNLVGMATIFIEVQNLNDNTPIFQQPIYQGSVAEQADLGTVVIDNVIATDADIGIFGQLTYVLQPDSAFFHVNDNKIVTRTGLTRSTQDNFTLTIIAEDGGVPALSGTATLFIQILDRGMQYYEQPTFPEQLYSTTLYENQPANTTVITIQALANEGETLNYRIVDGNDEGYFTIISSNNQGSIVANTSLDREAIPQYSLTIQARVSVINTKKKKVPTATLR